MNYNPQFLKNIDILLDLQKKELKEISLKFGLNNFLNRKILVEKLGFDFIYSSSQIKRNTYTKSGILALLEDGIIAGGKEYRNSKMILNLSSAFGFMLDKNLELNINTLKRLHFIISNEFILTKNSKNMRNINIACTIPYGEK